MTNSHIIQNQRSIIIKIEQKFPNPQVSPGN